MARNINDIVTLIWFIERKERGVFTTSEQICMLLNTGQLEVFEEYFSEYAKSNHLHDALNIFKQNYQFASAADGTVTLPANYMHLLPNVFTVTGSTINKVRFLNEDEWVDAITNQLRPVSTSAPIAKGYGSGFNLYPQTAQSGFLTYLRIPNVPVFGYNVSGRTITYDPSTSTQLDWDDVYINRIIAKALGYLGINLNERDITEFGILKAQET